MPLFKNVRPISDVELYEVKLKIDKGAVGISTNIVMSIIVRLELEIAFGTNPARCANCRKIELDCECEVYSRF